MGFGPENDVGFIDAFKYGLKCFGFYLVFLIIAGVLFAIAGFSAVLGPIGIVLMIILGILGAVVIGSAFFGIMYKIVADAVKTGIPSSSGVEEPLETSWNEPRNTRPAPRRQPVNSPGRQPPQRRQTSPGGQGAQGPQRGVSSTGPQHSSTVTQQRPPSPRDQQASVCPDCNSEMRYIEEYDSLYCDRCQEYK